MVLSLQLHIDGCLMMNESPQVLKKQGILKKCKSTFDISLFVNDVISYSEE